MRAAMPFLTFEGRAFEALEYYKEVFHHFDIIQMVNYTDSNKIQQAIIRIGDMHLMLGDSDVPSEFTFTPSMSVYIECEDMNEIELLYRKLKKNGAIHIPLDDYNMSKRYAWIQDQFGVSWQLNLI